MVSSHAISKQSIHSDRLTTPRLSDPLIGLFSHKHWNVSTIEQNFWLFLMVQ